MVAFAKTGDPNCDKLPQWPAYDREPRPTMIFDAECRVVNDPMKELRGLGEVVRAARNKGLDAGN